MKTTTWTAVALVAAFQFTGTLATVSGKPQTDPIQGQLTPQGCFSSGGKLVKDSSVLHVSSGNCWLACQKKNKAVSGLSTTNCYCGDEYPPKSSVIKNSECNYPCPGYGKEACGALGDVYSIFNTGVEVDVQYEPDATTTKAAQHSSTKAAQTSTTKSSSAPAATTTTTDNSSGKKKKSTPTAAIAIGVVVGVVALAAIAGIAVFFIRRRRNAEIEEEHRRNAAVNAFINGSKPPGSSGSISMTDSRLDPVMAHRRLSDGSIADNQDYSRRILRVTNA